MSPAYRTVSLALCALLAACGARPAAEAEAEPPAPGADLYVVYVDGGEGYMNRDGQIVIPPRFDLAATFSEGLARVYRAGDNRKAGFIDPSGEWVIEPRFRSAKSFSDGRAAAMDPKTRLWGYLDRTGAWAIPPTFMRATPFSEGRATVEVARDRGASIDVTGRIVFSFPPGADVRDPPEFAEGLMPLDLGDRVRYVDRDGLTVIEGPWKFGRGFSEGLAPVRHDDVWSFIDRSGKIVATDFTFAWGFCEGLAAVTPRGQEKTGYIDQAGEMIIPPTFERPGCFREGLAQIDAEGKVGYIDRAGAWAIAPTWDDPQSSAGYFRGGRAMVGRRDAEGRLSRGYIDRAGEVIFEPAR